MATEGIGGLVIETHNWGKSVAFWQASVSSWSSKPITTPGSYVIRPVGHGSSWPSTRTRIRRRSTRSW